ncbi:acetate--CoA ligase, partial [Candidatus Woesearchaeota archaeon]|nr:acetate--CoA ligase [Candidatus Woesearchaeota archaeon]
HLNTWKKNKAAIVWQAEDGSEQTYTYQHLHSEVCKFANVLKKSGLKKGDTCCLYLPMIPELVIAMLACTRIGVIHSIVFGGFSSQALKSRIEDCEAKIVITSDGSFRKGKIVPLKQTVDAAIEGCNTVQNVIVVQRTGQKINLKQGRDKWWHEEMSADDISTECPAEHMHAEDPLFILYTSGTTGKPKGVLHTNGGYLVYTYNTFKYIFDIKDEDTFWCTADIGWITGHSYLVYGPLSNGATSLMYEGNPTYPKCDRVWEIIEKHKVNILYTAPTLIRALMREGDDWPNKHDLSSLRLLGTVGEPINPEAWLWYYNVIGKARCPIVDTWWQTETGGVMITPLPGVTYMKPGSATRPFFGIEPEVLRDDGTSAAPNEEGNLVIKKPWPSMVRTVWGDPAKYIEKYFSRFDGLYLTGDGAKKDEDGYFWIIGRLDDVIKVSGHRLGTAEIESSIVAHPSVAESAVVPIPHELKGNAIFAYVVLKSGIQKSETLKKEIVQHVSQEIGPVARPEVILFADDLPKTRSGKIMRRILKAIAEGKDYVGNTTTLANPEIVDVLKEERKKIS